MVFELICCHLQNKASMGGIYVIYGFTYMAVYTVSSATSQLHMRCSMLTVNIPAVSHAVALLPQDVLVGLRSAVETVAAAEGLAPAQAPAPQGTAPPAQPAAQAAADTRQGHHTSNGGEAHYAYTWAVIMAAVSSTVSAALLLAGALALGLARACRPARRRAPGTNADTGAAARAKEPPDGGTGGPPTVLVKPTPARGVFAEGASQRRWAHARCAYWADSMMAQRHKYAALCSDFFLLFVDNPQPSNSSLTTQTPSMDERTTPL